MVLREQVGTVVSAIALTVAVCSAHAQAPSGTGERLAKESMALLAFAEMGNVGAKDAECRGTPFPLSDTDAIVDAELVPLIDALARAERKSDPKRRAELVSMLRGVPIQKDAGVTVVRRLYDQKKQEARAAFGDAGACAALSSMVQTVMQQKRLALREIEALLSAKR